MINKVGRGTDIINKRSLSNEKLYFIIRFFLEIKNFNFKELEEEKEKDKLVMLKLVFQKMKYF
jgi:hypothetical protein